MDIDDDRGSTQRMQMLEAMETSFVKQQRAANRPSDHANILGKTVAPDDQQANGRLQGQLRERRRSANATARPDSAAAA